MNAEQKSQVTMSSTGDQSSDSESTSKGRTTSLKSLGGKVPVRRISLRRSGKESPRPDGKDSPRTSSPRRKLTSPRKSPLTDEYKSDAQKTNGASDGEETPESASSASTPRNVPTGDIEEKYVPVFSVTGPAEVENATAEVHDKTMTREEVIAKIRQLTARKVSICLKL